MTGWLRAFAAEGAVKWDGSSWLRSDVDVDRAVSARSTSAS